VVAVYRLDRLSRSPARLPAGRHADARPAAASKFVSDHQSGSTRARARWAACILNLMSRRSPSSSARTIAAADTRDKVGAARRRGMWTGGRPVLGYDVVDKRLVVNPPEAEQVRRVFDLYLQLGGTLPVLHELRLLGIRNKRWIEPARRGAGRVAVRQEHARRAAAEPVVRGARARRRRGRPRRARGDRRAHRLAGRAGADVVPGPRRRPTTRASQHGAPVGPGALPVRCRDDADAHDQGGKALPVLRVLQGGEARARRVPRLARRRRHPGAVRRRPGAGGRAGPGGLRGRAARRSGRARDAARQAAGVARGAAGRARPTRRRARTAAGRGGGRGRTLGAAGARARARRAGCRRPTPA
jgi:hypothetical protein